MTMASRSAASYGLHVEPPSYMISGLFLTVLRGSKLRIPTEASKINFYLYFIAFLKFAPKEAAHLFALLFVHSCNNIYCLHRNITLKLVLLHNTFSWIYIEVDSTPVRLIRQYVRYGSSGCRNNTPSLHYCLFLLFKVWFSAFQSPPATPKFCEATKSTS